METYSYLGNMMGFGETFNSRIGKWVEQNLQKVKPEDELEIDVGQGKVRNLTRKEEYDFPRFPVFIEGVIEAGGLLSYLKQTETGRAIS